jgi:uroporphyrinogen-III synthase
VSLAPAAALRGFTIGITGDRRAQEQAEMLARRGARVVHGPTMSTTMLGDFDATIAATETVIAGCADIVVLTTGIGVRSWFAAAESAGLDEALREAISRARVVARGPKAEQAASAAGLTVYWRAASETSDEIVEYLAADDLPAKRVVVQRDGGAALLAERLAERGAGTVVDVPVYHWTLPDDDGPARRLLDAVLRQQVDAVTFTCQYAVHNAFELAADESELCRAFASEVLAVAVGPVTAAALRSRGAARVVEPQRSRIGSMVRALTAALVERRVLLTHAGHEVWWQGDTLAFDDGRAVELTSGERRLLGVLLDRAPAVVPRSQLVEAGTNGHAAEAAVARLRAKLGPLGQGIRTVRRRGYACTLERTRVHSP